MLNSLRGRLTLVMIILAIVPLIVVGVVLTFHDFNTQKDQAKELQAQIVLRVAQQVEIYITSRPEELSLAIKFVGLSQMEPAEQEAKLTELLSYDPYASNLILLDGAGAQLARASKLSLAYTGASVTDYSTQDAFVIPVSTRETYYGPVFLDETTGEPFMIVSIPMINPRSDTVDNVLVAQIQLKTVWDLIADQKLAPGQDIYLVSTGSGISQKDSAETPEYVIAHRDPSVVLRGTTFETHHVGTSGKGLGGEEVIFGIQRIEIGQQRFSVVSELTTAEAYRPAYQSLYTLLVSLIVIIIVSALVGFFVLRQVTAPLAVLTAAAQRIGAGDLAVRVRVGGRTEIGVLAQTFNGMAERLGDLVTNLEDRVRNRTRDLQTAADVSKQVTTVLDVNLLLPRLVELTRKGFEMYHVSVFLHNSASGILELVAATGEAGRNMLTEGKSFDILNEKGIVAQAACQREVVVVNDVSTFENFAFNPHLPDTRSEAAFPMTIGTNVIGVLDLQSEQMDRFTEDDIRVLTTLAEQIAVAVRNAQLFAQAEAAREKAEQADKVKSQFLASVSHELRTPLNAIINFTMFVTREKMGPVTEKQMDVLSKVVHNGKHLLNLINDVLDMSKIEAGSLELYAEDDVSLNEELETVVDTARSLIGDKPIELVSDIEDDLPLITGDRQRIVQIMLNIISNACKFTESGSITITAHSKDGEIVMAVKDTGPGIALEEQGSVFESFKQTETGLRQGKGTGLGMPISKNLAEAHGGRLWIESTVGEGSIFYVALPIRYEKLKALSR